jgi:hypothetical protein
MIDFEEMIGSHVDVAPHCIFGQGAANRMTSVNRKRSTKVLKSLTFLIRTPTPATYKIERQVMKSL